MKKYLIVAILLCFSTLGFAQVSGNNIYTGSNSRNQRQVVTKSVFSKPSNSNTISAEVNILYFAKIHQFKAVFGVSEEAKTVKESAEKINQRINRFVKSLKNLGVNDNEIFVDAVTQTRVYEYEIEENTVAKEVLKGFEIKKNVLIHFSREDLLNKIIEVGAAEGIYDLIKVDLEVEDKNKVLLDHVKDFQAVIAAKQQLTTALLNKKQYGEPRIKTVNIGVVLPKHSYQKYTAASTNTFTHNHYRSSMKKITARPVETFYYESKEPTDFDKVIYGNKNQLIPTVQFVITYAIEFEVL